MVELPINIDQLKIKEVERLGWIGATKTVTFENSNCRLDIDMPFPNELKISWFKDDELRSVYFLLDNINNNKKIEDLKTLLEVLNKIHYKYYGKTVYNIIEIEKCLTIT
jgi:hypothetical protein